MCSDGRGYGMVGWASEWGWFYRVYLQGKKTMTD